ncbi:hypothetical protein AV274_3890 [Blastocystis sp. ATCC 50177/Nand II]|uniref:Uncharacterized protein n=1 Tax=Blastocystis sp. subtype 1 (strain ATCC 50177 / NandII) TaxID=478820 RepID=A0A196SBH5_BLAHN|nr:hypothetical protein AV274_3890 [Blastocystis sp. ATCC 50177/Nand II]
MKYSNWVEFKVNAMELFLHNPELFRYNVQYAEHKKGISVSCTDNDIHIEYFTTQHSDLRKVDQLVQWYISKMASDLPTDQLVKSIREDIEEEKLKRSSAN